MKARSPDVASVGDIPIALVPHRPGPLDFAGEFRRMVAGAEINVCIGCARQGVSSGMIAGVSDSPLGRHVMRFARGEGIDASQIRVEPKPSPLLFKEMLGGGEFRVYYHREGTAGGALECDAAMEAYVRGAKAFLYTGIFPVLSAQNLRTLNRLLAAAKKGKTIRVFDPNIRMKLLRTPARARRLLLPLAMQTDVILLGAEEGEMLFGERNPDVLLDRLAEAGLRHAVVKCGEDGAVGRRGAERARVPAFPATEVVDSCGAGDAFNAGYLCAMLRGKGLAASLRHAARCAAFVVASDSDNEALPYAADLAGAALPR